MGKNVLREITVNRGNPLNMGATVIGNAVNFAITAKVDSVCEVILYEKGKAEEAARIPFENAAGDWECLCDECVRT